MKIKLLNKKEVAVCSGGQNQCRCEGTELPMNIDTEAKCKDQVCNVLKGTYWEFVYDIGSMKTLHGGMCPSYQVFARVVAQKLLGDDFVNDERNLAIVGSLNGVKKRLY